MIGTKRRRLGMGSVLSLGVTNVINHITADSRSTRLRLEPKGRGSWGHLGSRQVLVDLNNRVKTGCVALPKGIICEAMMPPRPCGETHQWFDSVIWGWLGQKYRRTAQTHPLAVGPPEQVRQPGPPTGALAVDGRVPEMQEEGQAPALRDVVRFRIEFGQGVGQPRLGRGDALGMTGISKVEGVFRRGWGVFVPVLLTYLTCKVGHFRDLEQKSATSGT